MVKLEHFYKTKNKNKQENDNGNILFRNMYLELRPNGARKHETPRCLRLLNACSINFDSDCGSIRQNEPLPGSS